jgi:hypothetical protein
VKTKSALELLEEKTGIVHSVRDMERAAQKARTNPADLTDEDIMVIDFFLGERQATIARKARERAQTATDSSIVPAGDVPKLPTQLLMQAAAWDTKREHRIIRGSDGLIEQVIETRKGGPRFLMEDIAPVAKAVIDAVTETFGARVAALEARPTFPKIEDMRETVANVIVTAIAASLRQRDKTIEALEARIAELELRAEQVKQRLSADAQGGTKPFTVEIERLTAENRDQTKRIAELEARASGCEYHGVFRSGAEYARGVLVSHRGGMWLSLAATTLAPGSNPTAWRLVVKEGRAER